MKFDMDVMPEVTTPNTHFRTSYVLWRLLEVVGQYDDFAIAEDPQRMRHEPNLTQHNLTKSSQLIHLDAFNKWRIAGRKLREIFYEC